MTEEPDRRDTPFIPCNGLNDFYERRLPDKETDDRYETETDGGRDFIGLGDLPWNDYPLSEEEQYKELGSFYVPDE